MKNKKIIKLKDINIGGSYPVVFILGPCQIESRDHSLMMAEKSLKFVLNSMPTLYLNQVLIKQIDLLFEQREVGLEEGLKILQEVSNNFGCPVLTDVHEATQCKILAEVVDIIQIPAFLSRQTDLLLAAGETQKPVNIKKGQFLSPKDMMKVAEKVSSTGNDNIFLCERGTSFGYNTLINDFRGLEIMAETGYPVIFDATHSVQQPSILGEKSGGERQFIPSLSRAACAIGVSGLFIETHENPDVAPSDGANMLNINDLPILIPTLLSIDNVIKNIT